MSEGATRDNGLEAPAYVALADIDPSVGDVLLSALRRALIAAYLEPMSSPEETSRQRLYVAADERTDARSVIEVAARSFAHDATAARRPDLLAGVDAQAEFDALVGDWHVDTLNAVRAAERDLTREDADWRMRLQLPAAGSDANDDDHPYRAPALAAPGRRDDSRARGGCRVGHDDGVRTVSRPARRAGLRGRNRRHSGRRRLADHAASRRFQRR